MKCNITKYKSRIIIIPEKGATGQESEWNVVVEKTRFVFVCVCCDDGERKCDEAIMLNRAQKRHKLGF